MNDEFLNIRLTESDVNLIMNALDFFASANDGDTGALELHDDLFEQIATIGVLNDLESTDLGEGFTFEVAEEHFIDAGVQAREQVKATSMAATRRSMRFGEFGIEDTEARRSEIKDVDVWERPNDPLKW